MENTAKQKKQIKNEKMHNFQSQISKNSSFEEIVYNMERTNIHWYILVHPAIRFQAVEHEKNHSLYSIELLESKFLYTHTSLELINKTCLPEKDSLSKRKMSAYGSDYSVFAQCHCT